MPSDRILDPGLLAWIEDVFEHWTRVGVGADARELLRSELEADLTQALAGGANAAELTSICASEFADRVAQAHDLSTAVVVPRKITYHALTAAALVPRQITYRALTATALGGAVLGAVASLSVVYPYAYVPTRLSEFWTAMTVHVIAAVLTLAFACAAVAWRFRGTETMRRTVGFTALLMGLAGALSVLPTMAVARFFQYSSAAPVVLLELTLVSTFVVLGIISARWLATRDKRPTNASTTLGAPSRG